MKPTVLVAVALVAGAAGFGIYRYGLAPRIAPVSGSTPAGSPQAPTAVEGEAQAPTILPDFSLQDREGTMRSIRSWTGKSMIVNFWATWCAPCRREIPLLRELQQTNGKENFQVVGVAVDFREDVLKYADQIGIDYPILIGEQDGLNAVNSFGLGSIGLPFTVFTDNQQRIVATHLGELTKPQSDVLLAVVRRVNAGELTPDAARTVATRQLAELGPEPG